MDGRAAAIARAGGSQHRPDLPVAAASEHAETKGKKERTVKRIVRRSTVWGGGND